ncbi:MAG: hypothetical protein KZQ95_13870 [Candidatus Thiodiazotropha sp. (ex Epidulcina cf. delphinae)]|nr:hypothetical protein [Candidatus Thiodiazotropha sp. (ex Epidulcina cf. delphinae)]
MVFDAVDADGRLIGAVLRARDEGPMALGKRFVLEQTSDASGNFVNDWFSFLCIGTR